MARQIKAPSEVHPEPIAKTDVPAEPAAEQPAEPEPEQPKKKSVRFQINQVQNIVFPDGSSYLARVGVHDIDDERLIKNLTDYATFPGSKRQIFILNQ